MRNGCEKLAGLELARDDCASASVLRRRKLNGRRLRAGRGQPFKQAVERAVPHYRCVDTWTRQVGKRRVGYRNLAGGLVGIDSA